MDTASSQSIEMSDSHAARQVLTTNLLRKLLKSAASNGKSSSLTLTSAHRQAIREICTSTDYQSQTPERLLIAFKASLNEAANDANIRPSPERSELLDHVVSVFIEELYRVAADGRVSADGDGRTSRNFIPSRNPSLSDARP
jgi:hypothetical protein